MWKSSFILDKFMQTNKIKLIKENAYITPYIKGIGGSWGIGIQDTYQLEQEDLVRIQEINDDHGDSTEPFMIQYEKRMEFMRRRMFIE